ncbi:hypothetical protein BZA05DRAFT_442222 [Tricharina praecox]|uniref:uncharacterized protein n=1 Tax=Tricharina praecox TaxID=43433 RepID=UPI00221F50F1|nr:uncharacterized protein BZA05DRAFT_442222 [Tricharina praecox]KAI5856547.1 hypothetical protein BZA05DRAFT_442222 [Tricharina praecox]
MLFQSLIASFLLASAANAAVAIGYQDRPDGSRRNLAWLVGTDACAAEFLSVVPASPCGRVFATGGYTGLTLEGCGGPLWLNQNGNFNANCKADNSYSKICNSGTVQKTYQC